MRPVCALVLTASLLASSSAFAMRWPTGGGRSENIIDCRAGWICTRAGNIAWRETFQQWGLDWLEGWL